MKYHKHDLLITLLMILFALLTSVVIPTLDALYFAQ